MHSDHATVFEVVPVGTISTPFENPRDAPRQEFLSEAIGTIELYDQYHSGMRGLTTGDTVDVLWFADLADRSITRVNRGQTGVFSSRSQDRPNPVGVTRCQITEVGDSFLKVKGVDMIDETPLLDIKLSMDPEDHVEW